MCFAHESSACRLTMSILLQIEQCLFDEAYKCGVVYRDIETQKQQVEELRRSNASILAEARSSVPVGRIAPRATLSAHQNRCWPERCRVHRAKARVELVYYFS
jgi:hypothetical protein